MNKTYKKSDIDKYIHKTKKDHLVEEERLEELVDTDGTTIDKNDNFRATTSIVRSKKTTDDFIRSATQGPEAYFIYGGPYYGINYSYTVSEGEEVLEETMSPELSQDLKAFHGKEIKTCDEDIRENQIDEMKSLVDEIIRKKRDNRGMVKKANEQDVMGGIGISIPDINELKQVHEKPMVIRKMNNFLDLVHKEGLDGEELAIVLNHILNNVDIKGMSDQHKETIGDKIKYGNEKGQ